MITALIALAALLAGFALGQLKAASRRVDQILREETRFRHPAGSKLTPERKAEIFKHVSPTPGAHAAREAESAPQTLAEAMGYSATPERIETLGEVLRRQGVVVENVERPPLAGVNERVVCGKPAMTNLGEVRCLQAPGHRGDC